MQRPTRLLSALLLAALAVAAPFAALSADQDDVLAADVLTGWQIDGGSHMAAFDLTLAPGWKTYWRSPGDAGIPPVFDWSGSENLAEVRFHWPSPSVFHTNGMLSIGYHDRLVLPVEVVAKDPARPVTLAATIELGVCREVCLPALVEVRGVLTAPGAPDPAIRAALNARPDTPSEAGVSGVSCTIDPIADGLRVTASIAMPRHGAEETVAFETANPAVWVAEAVTRRQGGTLVAMTELVPPEGAPFALDRSALTVTVISDRGSVEIAGCPAP
jgi:DsbC/DsbD-like thiol-disulfide interchange protein